MRLKIVLLCLCGALGLIRPALAQGADPVTIGAIEILSGPNAKYGVSIKQGFDLGVAEANRAGGVKGRPLAIAYENSAGSKEQAINAARQLLGRAKVPLLLGPTLSTEMFAVAPIAVERKTPIIGTSTTANRDHRHRALRVSHLAPRGRRHPRHAQDRARQIRRQEGRCALRPRRRLHQIRL